MSIFAISDLHLSFGTNKPMHIFDEKWLGYEDIMRSKWNCVVKEEDTVLICGDISWAMYLSDCDADFTYINSLNGTKIISKGNHDYWWSTLRKNQNYVDVKGFGSIKFLHNNAYNIDGVGVCGTRGYLNHKACKTDEDIKIYNREIERFILSAKALDKGAEGRIAVLHYPPDERFMELIHEFNIDVCVFGHLHANAQEYARTGPIDGIEYQLVSCDYLDFEPRRL